MQTLPVADWLPVLIPCRKLSGLDLRTCTLDDMVREAARQLGLPEAEADALPPLVRTWLQEGRAILLIDGLDEIADTTTRTAFCETLRQVAEHFDGAPIVVTSRIVGYREMKSPLRAGFALGEVAGLSGDDKDGFVRRWCTATLADDPGREKSEAEALIRDIHSSDRIERLTSNPMLLTTMVLVRRKVGQLPSRRHKLYEEAVKVLLSWRSDVDLPLEEEEALPQLEYVAFDMCSRGIKRLRRSELITLLEGIRREKPNLRALETHSPEQFIRLLEARTGLVMEAGEEHHDGRAVPVYEFRHLTFQEYLAGRALVEGNYPGHDPDSRFPDRIAPLAGRAADPKDTEHEVSESWREPLRLAVACCNNDDVDTALRAILRPAAGEQDTARSRAILAALCLADEPNTSKDVADEVIRRLVEQVGSRDGTQAHAVSGLDRAVLLLSTLR